MNVPYCPSETFALRPSRKRDWLPFFVGIPRNRSPGPAISGCAAGLLSVISGCPSDADSIGHRIHRQLRLFGLFVCLFPLSMMDVQWQARVCQCCLGYSLIPLGAYRVCFDIYELNFLVCALHCAHDHQIFF